MIIHRTSEETRVDQEKDWVAKTVKMEQTLNVFQQALGSCDRASWAKCEERKTNKMEQLGVYY